MELNPCHNGGTCINQAGGYVCQCPPGWTGKDCKVGKLLNKIKAAIPANLIQFATVSLSQICPGGGF